MSNNPFKSQPVHRRSSGERERENYRQPTQSRDNYANDAVSTQNRFKGKDAKKVFTMADEDFPVMGKPVVTSVSTPNATMNYKIATEAEKDEQPLNQVEKKGIADEYVSPGYVMIYMDEKRNIVHKYGDKNPLGYHVYNYDDEENNEPSANYVFQKLVESWELRKKRYDDLYGEGEYDRFYGIPNRNPEDEYLYSDCEDEEINNAYDYDEYYD